MRTSGRSGNGTSSGFSRTTLGQRSAEYTGMYLSRLVISPNLVIYDVVGGAGDTSMKFSDDVEVRCYSCGMLMGTNTIRSDSENDFTKMKYMNERRIRCRRCDNASNSAVRPNRSKD